MDNISDIFNSVLDKHQPKKEDKFSIQKQPNLMNQNIASAWKTRDSFDKSRNIEQYKVKQNQNYVTQIKNCILLRSYQSKPKKSKAALADST